MGGKGNKNWCTPPALYMELDDEFDFECDAAAAVDNHLAGTYFALDHPEKKRRDGLAKHARWTVDGAAFCNPPYGPVIEGVGGLYNWVKKGLLESKRGKQSVPCV